MILFGFPRITGSSSQGLPGAPRGSQELPGAPRGSQGLPEAPRASQGLPGARGGAFCKWRPPAEILYRLYHTAGRPAEAQTLGHPQSARALPKAQDGDRRRACVCAVWVFAPLSPLFLYKYSEIKVQAATRSILSSTSSWPAAAKRRRDRSASGEVASREVEFFF